MYVVTFYSFKGGVGRTMALVNVGLELARSGRRVLLVDFDLEAPGIETFNLPRPQENTPGIVDYITHYVATDEAPDAREYIYKSPNADIGEKGGCLWVMPAGRHDEMYGQRLNSIDWQQLYAEHDGYLMFEDLKAQWKEWLDPDYVLIDSRTGHTDVGGICTRQLPDAVTILFFPNDQNLFGLKKVVRDIRHESLGPRKKNIQLHFVTSNVPDLDDEDKILENRMQRFRESLGFDASTGIIIHHYSSLALLNQVIFTQERPRSRLAGEYRKLVEVIVRHNHEDREGALDFLSRVERPSLRNARAGSPLDLEKIIVSHERDGEILYRIANIQYRQGLTEEALALIEKAVDNGYRNPEVLLRRARLYRLNDDSQRALDDIKSVLNSNEVDHFDVNLAVRLLQDWEPEALTLLPGSCALASLNFDRRHEVASNLSRSRESLQVAEMILSQLVQEQHDSVVPHDDVSDSYALCLIGLGHFREAMQAISPTRPDPVSLENIRSAFNYAMAEWAESGLPPRDLFERVVDLDRSNSERPAPNYRQCIALALWAIGDIELAREKSGQARQLIMTHRRPAFSAWRYLTVSVEQFISDLDAMLSMINGKDILPTFMEQAVRTNSRMGKS